MADVIRISITVIVICAREAGGLNPIFLSILKVNPAVFCVYIGFNM